jgi:hypothetical protein
VKHFRSPLAYALLATLLSLAVLFHRTWRFGEVFSPADIVFSFYPWTYDAPLTPMTNSTRSDEAFFHQPLMETHWKRLKRGDWPDLDPDVLAGVPGFFHGLDVGRAFSPLSLPFYLAPADVAVTLYAPLRLLVAALCMWLYVRSLSLGAAASAVGALAWSLNGGFIAWLSAPMPTVALFLPAAWWLVDRVLDHDELAQTARDLGGLALVMGCVALGAYVPTILACLVTIGLYALVRIATRARWRAIPGLAAAAALGLLIGAVALVPMFDNLRSSPVSSRSMTEAFVPWTNLATFLVPRFWGSPVLANWWYPGVGSYPEFVTYLGVGTLVFAASGAAWWWTSSRDRRVPLFGALALGSLSMMYGWPPVTWLTVLPGFKQMSPLRWNVVLAASTAVLAAWGVEWIAGDRARPALDRDAGKRTGIRMNGSTWAAWLPAACVLATLGGLGLVTVVAIVVHLDRIRLLGLQPFLRGELAWTTGAMAVGVALVVAATLRRPRDEARARWSGVVGTACVALVATDLVRAGLGFNPTLPREKLYPSTPGIEYLQEHVPPNRFAPVGSGGELVNAHVWSLFGLASVTGLDFYGDPAYQAFLAAADGVPFTGAKWEFIGLRHPESLSLKLLGLLNVDYLALSPRDVGTAVGGYLPLVDLTSGRVVRQTLQCRDEGLRRVDVITGTYGRVNDGAVAVRLIDEGTGEEVARREVAAANLPSNDWFTLDFAPRPDSAGRRYIVEISAQGAPPERAAMLWSAVAEGNAMPAVVVDGTATARVLWIRTFSAPSLVGDAPLVYARDLNIYRNPHSQPRAWFARDVAVMPLAAHLDRLRAPAFDPAALVVVAERPAHRPTPRGRVSSLDLSEPDVRRISVDAPDGGVLVVGERWRRGWRATVDSMSTPIVEADAVLMAVAVPPGAREVRLEFEHPLVRPSMAISALALLAALALIVVPPRHGRLRR